MQVDLQIGGMAFEVEVAALERDDDVASDILGRDVLSYLSSNCNEPRMPVFRNYRKGGKSQATPD